MVLMACGKTFFLSHFIWSTIQYLIESIHGHTRNKKMCRRQEICFNSNVGLATPKSWWHFANEPTEFPEFIRFSRFCNSKKANKCLFNFFHFIDNSKQKIQSLHYFIQNIWFIDGKIVFFVRYVKVKSAYFFGSPKYPTILRMCIGQLNRS